MLASLVIHLLLALHAVSAPLEPQVAFASPPAGANALLASYMNEIRIKYNVTGFGVAAVNGHGGGDGEWETFAGGYGAANVRGDPVTHETLFGIASNSKLFTMLSVGLLIERGTKLPNGEMLDWNTKVKAALPGWELKDEYASEHVDITDLMCEWSPRRDHGAGLIVAGAMRSGMPRHDSATGEMSPAEVIANFRNLRPSAEVRQAYQYNNHHFIALSHIIPTLTGIPFHVFVQQDIFDPLNMTDATYNATHAAETGRLADGFIKMGKNVTRCAEQWEASAGEMGPKCLGESKCFGFWTTTDGIFTAGDGGVILSPTDMVKWLRELLDPKVLPKSLIDRAAVANTVGGNGKSEYDEIGVTNYGLAQTTFTYRGHNVVSHGGSLPGQHSILLRIPSLKYGIIIAINEEDYVESLLRIMTYRSLDLLLGLDPIDWDDRLMAKEFAQKALEPVSPAISSPAPQDTCILGVYRDAGYGDMYIYPLAHYSDYAEPLASAVEMLPFNATGPIYGATRDQQSPSFLYPPLLLTHFSGDVFNWTYVGLAPAIGRDREPSGEWIVAMANSGSAVIREDGLGMFGDFWGAGPRVKVVQASEGMRDVEKRAEVWFERVSGLP